MYLLFITCTMFINTHCALTRPKKLIDVEFTKDDLTLRSLYSVGLEEGGCQSTFSFVLSLAVSPHPALPDQFCILNISTLIPFFFN